MCMLSEVHRRPERICDVLSADYYYYATAGGARIWVRPITVLSYLLQQIH